LELLLLCNMQPLQSAPGIALLLPLQRGTTSLDYTSPLIMYNHISIALQRTVSNTNISQEGSRSMTAAADFNAGASSLQCRPHNTNVPSSAGLAGVGVFFQQDPDSHDVFVRSLVRARISHLHLNNSCNLTNPPTFCLVIYVPLAGPWLQCRSLRSNCGK
jgi:hypothetical protein